MGVISKIVDGVWSIIKGVGEIALAIFEMAFALVVLIIYGTYSAAKSLFEYAKGAWKRIKESQPNAKPRTVVEIGPKALISILDKMETEVSKKPIYFSDLQESIDETREKLEEGDITGLQVMEGEDEYGDDTVLDSQFFKADDLDIELEKADNQNKTYTRQIV